MEHFNLAKKIQSGKATNKNVAKAKQISSKLYKPPTESIESKIITQMKLEYLDKPIRLYEAILLALASFKVPPFTIVPVLKGGTIATQYSNKKQNIQDIDIQFLPMSNINSLDSFKNTNKNNRFWAKQIGGNMKYIVGLQVYMVKFLNSLKGLKKGVAKATNRKVERVGFRLRAKHITATKTVTLLAVDLRIKFSDPKPNSKNEFLRKTKLTVPVFDIVLGDARSTHKFNKSEILKIENNGKVLFQYNWDWVSKDLESIIQMKNNKSVEKAPKRMSRWLNGLVRTPTQRTKNSRKLLNIISRFDPVPGGARFMGHHSLRQAIMRYSDNFSTQKMLIQLLSVRS